MTGLGIPGYAQKEMSKSEGKVIRQIPRERHLDLIALSFAGHSRDPVLYSLFSRKPSKGLKQTLGVMEYD